MLKLNKSNLLEMSVVKQIETLLQNEDVQKRIEAVQRFHEVPPDAREKLFQMVAGDFNHEVRETAANLIELYPKLYTEFIDDPDPQVRIAIINNLIKIRKTEPDILSNFENLSKDSVAEVRCALAKVLHEHAEFKEANGEIDENKLTTYIISNIQTLLNDRNDDVRIAASENMKHMTIQFGFDFVFEKMRECLHSMLTDTQWRVRINAIEILFGLALVCPDEFFKDNLFPFLCQFLRDPCSKVRQFAISSLPTLASQFKSLVKENNFKENLSNLSQSDNFLHRQTYLYCISELAAFYPPQYRSNLVFQPMIRMLKDPVQNVVLLAIELLSKHKDSIHPFRRQYELKPTLEELAENASATIKAQAAKLLEILQ